MEYPSSTSLCVVVTLVTDVPVKDNENVNNFVKLLPSTTTGIETVPFLAVRFVVAVKVRVTFVESLLLIEQVKPVTPVDIEVALEDAPT